MQEYFAVAEKEYPLPGLTCFCKEIDGPYVKVDTLTTEDIRERFGDDETDESICETLLQLLKSMDRFNFLIKTKDASALFDFIRSEVEQ